MKKLALGILGAFLAVIAATGVYDIATGQPIGTTTLALTPGSSTVAPAIRATGAPANISINLVPKGTGTVQVAGVPISVSGGTFTSLNINPGPLNVTGPLFIQPGTAVTLKRVSAVIAHNITDAPTTGAVLQNLYTFPIEANTLANDGESIEITAAVSSAANANNKTLTIAFGATTLITSTAIAANNEAMNVRCHIYRTGAATQKSNCFLAHSPNGAQTDLFATNSITTSAEVLAGAVNLVVTGTTPTANGDLTARSAKVYWHPVGQ